MQCEHVIPEGRHRHGGSRPTPEHRCTITAQEGATLCWMHQVGKQRHLIYRPDAPATVGDIPAARRLIQAVFDRTIG